MPDDIHDKMTAAMAEKPAGDVLKDLTFIKPIQFDDAKGRWVFAPQPDITALEAALISQLFAAIVVRYLKGDHTRFDWREYLTRDHAPPLYNGVVMRCDLARHFKPVE